ncbi:nuclear transport factor 2 family protein [Fulvivirgaceae bacterium PWU4]|uniref:Nuclear transport factor 2 family protein n=1 Tax=Chryseosolibacter histidini TaxID=2782349 RepID=A0AAP2DLM4_9BACT|nr:nuclear transport factor 2 family protein [Chryseosolibacter histidini]MBT1698641.1 nuclear transport factor 2 family protein [Chryseosolibacter histidini]
MKKLIFMFFLLPAVVFAQNDEASIKQVVTNAYIQGIHNRGSVDEIRKGFHPTFSMLRLVDNEIKPLPIEEWIANLEKAKKESTTPPVKTEGKFVNVDVTGNAAVVKLELYRENKKVFTDYLVLYKFAEGWRIVSKTFYRHS